MSRAYYAMYHAAYAILLWHDLEPRTHRGLVDLFAEHIVRPGDVGHDLLAALKHAKDIREEGDYEVAASPEQAEVEALLGEAHRFVDELEALPK